MINTLDDDDPSLVITPVGGGAVEDDFDVGDADALELIRECTTNFIRTFASCSDRLINPDYVPTVVDGPTPPATTSTKKAPGRPAVRSRSSTASKGSGGTPRTRGSSDAGPSPPSDIVALKKSNNNSTPPPPTSKEGKTSHRQRLAIPLLPCLPDSSIGATVSFAPKQKVVYDAENPDKEDYSCNVVNSLGFPGCVDTLHFQSVYDDKPSSVEEAIQQGLLRRITIPNGKPPPSTADQKSVPASSFRKVFAATSRVMKSPVWHACMRKAGMKFINQATTTKTTTSTSDVASPKWTIYWGGRLRDAAVLKSLQPHHRVNHFPGTWCMGRKDNLAMYLKKAYQKYPHRYSFVPFTYLLPHDLPLLERDVKEGGTFILKPPSGACGRGIQVFQRTIPEEVYTTTQPPASGGNNKKKVAAGTGNTPTTTTTGSDSEDSSDDDEEGAGGGAGEAAVVQRYLTNPLLINGFKTDLRVYVAVTSYDPLKIYIYNEGLLRFATSQYTMDNVKDAFGHLTNYSVNKRSSNFKKAGTSDDEESSKWTLHAMKRFFESQDGWDFDAAWSSVEEVVVKTIMACESGITSYILGTIPHRFSCFEIYGFDVMFDDKFKAHLIEVNVMPSLASASALDKHIKGHMVADVLTLVGIPLHGGGDNNDSGSSNIPFRSQRKGTSPHTTNYFTPLSNLDAEELHMLRLHELELHRSGGFDCVFPSPGAQDHYASLYTPRHMTELLVAWETFKCKINASGKPLQPLLDALRVAAATTAAPKKTRALSTSAAPVEVKQPHKKTRTPSNAPKPLPPKTVTALSSLPPLARKTSSQSKVELRRPSLTEQVPITTFHFTDGAQK